jgi:hypothetical protein
MTASGHRRDAFLTGANALYLVWLKLMPVPRSFFEYLLFESYDIASIAQ